MSDYIVKIIPYQVQYMPLVEERNMIQSQLSEIISNKRIIQRYFDEVSFIDPGSNLEVVKCNHCGKRIEIEWWAEQMDICSSDNLLLTAPCCNTITSLNELDYIQPAGFAKYVIEIMNPNKDEEIEIEKLIEDKNYKLIKAHY